MMNPRLRHMLIRVSIVAMLAVFLGVDGDAAAAPLRTGLGPLRPTGPYPARLRLLSAKEQGLRTKQLEAKNPGWKLVVDRRGYIKQARQRLSGQKSSLRSDFVRWHRQGKLPASFKKRIEGFIAKNRRQLARRIGTLRTTIALGGPQGSAGWTLHFARGVERVRQRRLSKRKLHRKLLVGRRVVVSRSICPPCRPGGRCACATKILRQGRATRASTRLLIQQVELRSADTLELRLVASLLPRRADAKVLPHGHIDAITGRPINLDNRDALYPSSVKAGIWISCVSCTDPFLGGKRVR